MSSLHAELVLDARAGLGESPVWDAVSGRLVWVDIERGQIHFTDTTTGDDEVRSMGEAVTAVVPRSDRGFLVACRTSIIELDDPVGPLVTVAQLSSPQTDIRFNDGKCDPRGRFWVGTMSTNATPAAGSVYRYAGDGLDEVLSGVTISNGLDWCPDGRILYYIDTPTLGVDAWDFDLEAATLANRRRLVDIPPDSGRPDGMTVDAEGCLWVAMARGGQVRRYAPDGALDRIVTLPVSMVTSCAFGDSDYSGLYITTAQPRDGASEPRAGGVFRCDPGVSGRPPHAFACRR